MKKYSVNIQLEMSIGEYVELSTELCEWITSQNWDGWTWDGFGKYSFACEDHRNWFMLRWANEVRFK